MIEMTCCQKPEIKDLTQGQGDLRHYFCTNCRAHIWRDEFYTAQQWHDWVNEQLEDSND